MGTRKHWYRSIGIWGGIIAGLNPVGVALVGLVAVIAPDSIEAVRTIGAAAILLMDAVAAVVLIAVRVRQGADPDKPEPVIGKLPKAKIGAGVAVIAALLLASSCNLANIRPDVIIDKGCDLLTALFPDNEPIRIACEVGEIISIAVIAAPMLMSDDADATKSVDVFDPLASPTLHMGCGAWALRCHRYGAEGGVSLVCGEVLSRCEMGRSTVLDLAH